MTGRRATDELRSFSDGEDLGHVWTTAWDGPENAADFRDAFAASLAERTDEHADRIAVRAVGEEVVAVVAGLESFRSAVEIAADGRAVRVTIGDDDGATPPVADAPGAAAGSISVPPP